MIGRNLNDFNQAKENPGPSQKTKKVQNPKENPGKEIPRMFRIPIYNRFQILENLNLQTQDKNENQDNEKTIMIRIFYNSELTEELKNDLNTKIASRKTQISTKHPRLEIKTRGLILKTG